VDAATDAVASRLASFHEAHPLDEGAPLAEVRAVLATTARELGAPRTSAVPAALLDRLTEDGTVVRTATVVRLPTHVVALTDRDEDLGKLLAAIGGDRERTPPTIKELVAQGFDRSLIDAAGRAGIVARLSQDLVVTPGLVSEAETVVRAHADEGCTVSQIREALGTSRKYAVPIAEWMDTQGITRRVGDLRFPRD
jgi:selenocysteine-specific elongation factor